MKLLLLPILGVLAYIAYGKYGQVDVAKQAADSAEFGGLDISFNGGKMVANLKIKVTNVSKSILKVNALKAYIQALGTTIATVEPSADTLKSFIIQPETQTTLLVPVQVPIIDGALTAAQYNSVKELVASGFIEIEGFPRIELKQYKVAFDASKYVNEIKAAAEQATDKVNEVRLAIVKKAVDGYKQKNPTHVVTVWVDESIFGKVMDTYYFLAKLPDTQLSKNYSDGYKIGITGNIENVGASKIDQNKFKKISV